MGKQELPELHSACVSARGKTRTVLKLAVDSINLGLCDFRNYFARPSLIEQTNHSFIFKEESCLLNCVINSMILVSISHLQLLVCPEQLPV